MKTVFTKRFLSVTLALCILAAFSAGLALPCFAGVYVAGYMNGEPLPEEYCTPIDEYIEVDMEVTPVSKYDVIDAMRYFYSMTGVQPYMIITDSLNGGAELSAEDASAFLGENYIRLFGGDGGHLLVLAHISESYEYRVRFFTLAGENTSMVFDGNVDVDKVFNSCFDDYYGDILAGDEIGSDAFRDDFTYVLTDVFYGADAEVMQTVEFEEYRDYPDYYSSSTSASDVLTVIFAVFLIPAGLVIGFVSRARREDREEAAARQVREEIKYAAEEALRKAGKEQKKEEPKKVKYPVTCPGCGATAYPNDDGTCQYCGRWIV